MLQRILCVCLLVCYGIGCTIEAPENDDEESVVPMPAVPTLPVEPIAAECPPEFHGELISGKLNALGSDRETIHVNAKRLHYYYTLNLLLKDSVTITVVLDEAALAFSDKGGQQILDEDFLLVKLDRLLKPGIWQGTLVKNLTRNISFE